VVRARGEPRRSLRVTDSAAGSGKPRSTASFAFELLCGAKCSPGEACDPRDPFLRGPAAFRSAVAWMRAAAAVGSAGDAAFAGKHTMSAFCPATSIEVITRFFRRAPGSLVAPVAFPVGLMARARSRCLALLSAFFPARRPPTSCSSEQNWLWRWGLSFRRVGLPYAHIDLSVRTVIAGSCRRSMEHI